MDQRQIVVEPDLDERAGGRLVDGKVVHRTRHARTRFVTAPPASDPPEPPKLGDPWCAVTVRARLQRIGWVLRRDPRVGPNPDPPSCMPEVVRERWKDAAPGSTILRISVPAADHSAVNETLIDLLRFKDDEEAKAVIYAIVEKTSGEDLGITLRCSGKHARTLMARMLDDLATAWNALPWRPDAKDIERAKKLLHRNIK